MIKKLHKLFTIIDSMFMLNMLENLTTAVRTIAPIKKLKNIFFNLIFLILFFFNYFYFLNFFNLRLMDKLFT